MPMDKSKYPPNWKQISLRIRERDGHRCKWCGVSNRAVIIRSAEDAARYLIFSEKYGAYCDPTNGIPVKLSEMPAEFAESKDIRITLTVAHLDHDTTNNSDENLAALCQRCHLKHDAKYHAANAKVTRLRKKEQDIEAAGQGRLL